MKAPTPNLTLLLLGSGAVRANPNRGGTSQLLQIGDEVLLFDCGRCAVQNMARFGVPVETVDRLFISHLHFDHVCDVAQLVLLSWNNGRGKCLPITGPRGMRDFMEFGVRQGYARDIQSRLGHGKDPAGLEWQVAEIEEDGIVLDEPEYVVRALATEHAGLASYNYRVDAGERRVVITSDTVPDERLAEFARGADLLVCECSGTREFLSQRPWGGWHMAPEDVAHLARSAGVKRAIIKHLVIEDWSDDPRICEKMADTIRQRFRGTVEVGIDGMRIEL